MTLPGVGWGVGITSTFGGSLVECRTRARCDLGSSRVEDMVEAWWEMVR